MVFYLHIYDMHAYISILKLLESWSGLKQFQYLNILCIHCELNVWFIDPFIQA